MELGRSLVCRGGDALRNSVDLGDVSGEGGGLGG